MNRRAEVYLEILQHGLLNIRAAAFRGDNQLCHIEADHLHNLPTLVNEENENRHRYYFEAERSCYLDRLKERSSQECSIALDRYRELWQELERLTTND